MAKEKPRYSTLKYDDPTLPPECAYWSALCNGFTIGTASTKEGAEEIIRKHKASLILP